MNNAISIESTKKECKHEPPYNPTTVTGVKKLLADRHAIGSLRYRGDTDASDILLDLNEAIDRARLSRRQAEAIAIVYGLGVTQNDAAEVLGIRQPTLSKYLDEAARKIARVYRNWEPDNTNDMGGRVNDDK